MSQGNKLRGALVMCKEDFWNLIDQTKETCGDDKAEYMTRIQNRLTELGPQYAQDFHDILHAYSELANKFGLWSAACMMGNGSDDGFLDFRTWLISQGQEIYRAALADPDTLADVDPGDGYWFEGLTYIGDRVLQNLTGNGGSDGPCRSQPHVPPVLHGDTDRHAHPGLWAERGKPAHIQSNIKEDMK